MKGWSKVEWANVVGGVLEGCRDVNLGVGLPARLSDYLSTSRWRFHCENGIIGMGSSAQDDTVIPELVNASTKPVTLAAGAAVVDIDVSFGLVRGGHLDATVLGAYQVSASGDLANWSHPANPVAGVGGAMDLAAGVPMIIVMMHHMSREHEPRIVADLTLPATGRQCVSYICTEFCLMKVTEEGLLVTKMAPEVTSSALELITDAPLRFQIDLEATM